MLGYAYLTEKRRMKKLNAALQKLEGIPGWSLKVARAVYPAVVGKDLKVKAAEYEIYIEDIEDNKSGVNAVLLSRYVDQVRRLAQLAKKAEGAAGLGAFSMDFVTENKNLLLGGLGLLLAVKYGPKLLK